jgi:hypothetical protein
METFKERQIEIWRKENEILDETNVLLTEVLESLTPDQSQYLKGYGVDEYRTVVKLVSPTDLLVQDDFEGEELISIGKLRQIEQKEMLDFIFFNILHI